MLAEFLGTLIMVFLICGVCAEERLHINKQPSSLAGPMGSGKKKKKTSANDTCAYCN